MRGLFDIATFLVIAIAASCRRASEHNRQNGDGIRSVCQGGGGGCPASHAGTFGIDSCQGASEWPACGTFFFFFSSSSSYVFFFFFFFFFLVFFVLFCSVI
jgi:hypothetical protein